MKKTIYVLVYNTIKGKLVIVGVISDSRIIPHAKFTRADAIGWCKTMNKAANKRLYSYRKATVEW